MVNNTVTIADLEDQLFKLRARGEPKITAAAEAMVKQNITLMKQKEILLEKKITDLNDKLESILRELAHLEADVIETLADLRERILS